MKLGFASIYPSRPHVKHLAFIASQAEKFGHSIYWLECDDAVDICFAKLGKNWVEKKFACLKCSVGGLRGFLEQAPDALSTFLENAQDSQAQPGYSAISTLGGAWGIADKAEIDGEEFRSVAIKLQKSIDKAQYGAEKWIEKRKLDAVFCYNGRFDLTNAIKAAAERKGIPFISIERSWYGIGIQIIIDGTPLSLKGPQDFVLEWSDRPLTKFQLSLAFDLIASRFQKRSVGEYRQYNLTHELGHLSNTKKIECIYLPSSIFERLVHPDWEVGWKSDFEAIQTLVKCGALNKDGLVVRGHPQWARFSSTSDNKYQHWCDDFGIRYIPSSSKVDTQELIWESDKILVNGSSTAFEAGLLGKPIINISQSFYSQGKFLNSIFSSAEINNLQLNSSFRSSREIIRHCLRTLYTFNFRFMQFTDEIKAENAFEYLFKDINNENYFEDLIKSRRVKPSDQEFSNNTQDEDDFLDSYINNCFDNIRKPYFYFGKEPKNVHSKSKMYSIGRRHRYFAIDVVDRLTR